MKDWIKRTTPRWTKRRGAFLYGHLVDFYLSLRGRQRESTPPYDMRLFVGGDDFNTTGREFLGHFRNLCTLTPDERVLDVGCGPGRMATPLTGYLDKTGAYDGFDIVRPYISWCQDHITPEHPNFRFQVADIFNKAYNPKGKCEPREYVFPYATSSFDFAFATSVFTHMLPADVQHYLAEASRVLRPGGRYLFTFFVLPEGWDPGRFKAGVDFRYDMGEFWVYDKNEPEAAVAYPEQTVRGLLSTAGLTVKEPIRYGAWSGRMDFLSGQDIIVGSKA